MWRKKLWQATLIGVVFVLFAATVASAKPPADRCHENPAHPSCSDDGGTEDELWTCQARIDNGATAWVQGKWNSDEGYYEVALDPSKGYIVPACIDLDDPRDGQARDEVGNLSGATSWEVTLVADVGHRPRGDVLVVLEREVHGDTYASQTMPEDGAPLPTNTVVTLDATLGAPATDHLVLVAMPAHRLNWEVTALTVKPLETGG